LSLWPIRRSCCLSVKGAASNHPATGPDRLQLARNPFFGKIRRFHAGAERLAVWGRNIEEQMRGHGPYSGGGDEQDGGHRRFSSGTKRRVNNEQRGRKKEKKGKKNVFLGPMRGGRSRRWPGARRRGAFPLFF